MADGHKTPSELVDYMIKTGIDKATKPLFKRSEICLAHSI